MWSTSRGTLPVVGFTSPQPHCEHLKFASLIRCLLMDGLSPCSTVAESGSFFHWFTTAWLLAFAEQFEEQYLEELLFDLYSKLQKLQTFGPLAILVPLTPDTFLALPLLLNLAEQLREQNFCLSSLYWKSCLHSTHCLVLSFLGAIRLCVFTEHDNEQNFGLFVSIPHSRHFMYLVYHSLNKESSR